jgi:hypothetical protein
MKGINMDPLETLRLLRDRCKRSAASAMERSKAYSESLAKVSAEARAAAFEQVASDIDEWFELRGE